VLQSRISQEVLPSASEKHYFVLEVSDLGHLPLEINEKIKTNTWSHDVELITAHAVDDNLWPKMVGIA
jgi:hypothetical protein